MAIDPSIALQLRPFQMEPQTNALARIVGLQGQMRQNALGELQMQQAQEAAARDKQVRDVMSGNDLSKPEGLSALMRVDPIKAMAIQKEQVGLEETKAKTAHYLGQTKELTRKDQESVLTQHRQELGAVFDPASAQAWVKRGLQRGLVNMQIASDAINNIPDNPAEFSKWRDRQMMEGIKLEEQIKLNTPDLKTVNLGGQEIVVDMNPRTRGNAPMAYTKTATPGEVMTDNRVRSEGAANRGQAERHFQAGQNAPKLQYDADRGLLVDQRTGAAQPVMMGGQPIGGKDEKLNEGQSKALMFGSRMADARGVIDKLEGKGVYNRGGIKAAAETAGRVAGLGTEGMGGTLADVAGSATNWTQSKEQQSYEAAKRNWVAAVLRKESGAAIGAGEYRDADNQYFPQPGDSSTVKAEKANRRRLAEQAMLEEVPKGIRGKYTEQAPNAAKSPSVINFSELK